MYKPFPRDLEKALNQIRDHWVLGLNPAAFQFVTSYKTHSFCELHLA